MSIMMTLVLVLEFRSRDHSAVGQLGNCCAVPPLLWGQCEALDAVVAACRSSKDVAEVSPTVPKIQKASDCAKTAPAKQHSFRVAPFEKKPK